jgi:hypothetical protein
VFQYRIAVSISVISLYFAKLISVIFDISYSLCRFAMAVSTGTSTRHGEVGRASVGWMEHPTESAQMKCAHEIKNKLLPNHFIVISKHEEEEHR